MSGRKFFFLEVYFFFFMVFSGFEVLVIRCGAGAGDGDAPEDT